MYTSRFFSFSPKSTTTPVVATPAYYYFYTFHEKKVRPIALSKS